MTSEEYADHIVSEFARKFENEYHAIWDPKTNQCEYAAFYIEPIQGLVVMSSHLQTSSQA